MPQMHAVANPFALMLDPEAVIARMERSERLGGLQRRVCRPLDRPLLGHRAGVDADEADDADLDDEGPDTAEARDSDA